LLSQYCRANSGALNSWYSFIVPGNIQPHSLFHIPDPWDGAVASIDETVVDIWRTNRFSLKSSRRIPLSYFGGRAWNSGCFVLLCPFGCVGPLSVQYQEDLTLVRDLHAQNGKQFNGFDLQIGWSLQQGSILFFLSLDCSILWRHIPDAISSIS